MRTREIRKEAPTKTLGAPYSRVPGGSHEPLGHLSLDHHDRSLNRRAVRGKVSEDRACDRIRQVARDDEIFPEGRKINRCGITFDEPETAVIDEAREFVAEDGGHISIALDGGDLRARRKKRRRERSKSRSKLDDLIDGRRARRSGDRSYRALRDEEVL